MRNDPLGTLTDGLKEDPVEEKKRLELQRETIRNLQPTAAEAEKGYRTTVKCCPTMGNNCQSANH